jgi:hypothetical protein
VISGTFGGLFDSLGGIDQGLFVPGPSLVHGLFLLFRFPIGLAAVVEDFAGFRKRPGAA